MFFTDASRGGGLKLALPLKTRQQDVRPCIRAWFRVDIPSILPLPPATASHMGGKSPSPATLYTKQRWKRESVATFTADKTGEGEVNAAPTPAAATPCSDSAMAYMAVSERPRAARPVARGGQIGCPPLPCGNHPPGVMPCIGG